MRIGSLQCRVMKIAVSFVVGAIVIDLASSPQRRRKGRSEVVAGHGGACVRARALLVG